MNKRQGAPAGSSEAREARGFDQRMIGREGAGGIDRGGVACQMKGLAATAAEVLCSIGAAPARLRHPALAAKLEERRRIGPYRGERAIAHGLEMEPGDRMRGVAGQH